MAGVSFEEVWRGMKESIKRQMISRGYRVSNEIRNSVVTTIRGQGHGRRYKVPGTMKAHYTASAPGEVPAVRTGAYRMSWEPSTYVSAFGADLVVISKCESNLKVNGYILGDLLEGGPSKMAPRPHVEKIAKKSERAAMRIYSEPYF